MRQVALYFLTSMAAATIPLQMAAAQEAFKLCRVVKEDAERLKCYDGIAALAGATKPDAPEPPSVWLIDEKKSPLDDSPVVSAGLSATDGQGMMILRCKERSSDVVVMPSRFIQCGGDSVRVTYRIDQGEPIDARWSPSSACNAVFAGSPVPFMRALRDGGRLFVRVTDRQGVPHDAVFDLGAVGDVRAKIAAACQWDKAAPKAAKPQASAVKP
jgi:hypothetical protein